MSLGIVSFNCKGFKSRNFDYLRDLYNKHEIMMIQETWLYSFEENVIRNTLKGCNCYTVSAMSDTDVGRQGRTFGGCAIIWNNSLNIQMFPINLTSTRICAVEGKWLNDSFLFINVYMPVLDQSMQNNNEFVDTLNEISSVLRSYPNSKVIIGGDLNVDFDRDARTRVYESLNNFLCEEMLITHDETMELDDMYFTFESVNGSRSCIDHFIFCENVYDIVKGFSVLRDGNNLSDHLPISLEVEGHIVGAEPVNEFECNNIIRWDLATNISIDNYKMILDDILETFNLPQSVLNCNDHFCTSHNGIILEYFKNIIDAVRIATAIAIPKKQNIKKKGIPGWNQYVQSFKNSSILWNNIWKSAGSPIVGELYNMKNFTKRKYHASIKYVFKNRNSFIRDKIACSLQHKNTNNFWQEIKKLNSSPNTVTNVVDNVMGENNIVNIFKDKYRALYNEHDFNYSSITRELNKLISNKCKVNKCNFNHEINRYDVIEGIKNLKNNKNDPIYHITSNCIKNGSVFFHDKLAVAFKLMLSHGISSEQLNKSIIISIPKDKRKSCSNSNKYRGI